MPVWYAKFKLKDLLGEDDSPEEVRRVAMLAHERMLKEREHTLTLVNAGVRNPNIYPEWDAIADEFHSVAVVAGTNGGGESGWFNDVMNELYEFGDRYRLWID